jgi:hypothetical protein
MSSKLEISNVSSKTRSASLRCGIFRASVVPLLSISLIWPLSPASSEEDQPPFRELPENIAEFLADQGFPNLEFVVLAMPGRIVSFRVGTVDERPIDEGNLQAGEFVVPGDFGFDFAKREPGFHVVVISSASPGSGNDCRRGGSCREANK